MSLFGAEEELKDEEISEHLANDEINSKCNCS